MPSHQHHHHHYHHYYHHYIHQDNPMQTYRRVPYVPGVSYYNINNNTRLNYNPLIHLAANNYYQSQYLTGVLSSLHRTNPTYFSGYYDMHSEEDQSSEVDQEDDDESDQEDDTSQDQPVANRTIPELEVHHYWHYDYGMNRGMVFDESYINYATEEEEEEEDNENVQEIAGLSEKVISENLITRGWNCEYDSIEICVVCQDNLGKRNQRIGILDCEHQFHSSCITHWLKEKNVCPLCKTTPALSA